MTNQLLTELQQGQLTCRAGQGFADQLEAQGHTITGRAVPYGVTVQLTPELHERFEPGVFRRADLRRVRLCASHGDVIGSVDSLDERADGLHFTATIADDPDLPRAREQAALVRTGLVDELSVGFRTVKRGSTVEQTSSGAVLWTHRRAALSEISLVPWGAYARGATLTRAQIIDPEALQLEARRQAERDWLASQR